MNVYAQASLFDTGKAVDALPDLFQPPRSSQALPATVTDGGFARRLVDMAMSVLSDGADAVGLKVNP